MKLTSLLLILIPFFSACSGQITWSQTNNWKVYVYNGDNIPHINLDSLKNYCKNYTLNQDSINYFLNSSVEIPTSRHPVWMGAFVASYDLQGKTNKIEVSQYGGFFRDDGSGKYFEVPANKKDEWQEYWRNCYIAAYNK